MKKYILLTKVLLKTGTDAGFSQKKKKKGRLANLDISRKALYIFIVICFMPMLFSFYMSGREGYYLLNQVGQGGVVVSLICLAGTLAALVFGVLMVVTVYYYSNDIEKLLPLPLHPQQIVAAKFTVTLVYEYLTMLILVLPVLLGYGIAAGAGPLFWLAALVALLLIPVAPLVYGSVFAMIVMMLFKRVKNKDFLMTVYMVIFLIIVLGVNGFSSRFASMDPEKMVRLLLEGNDSLAGAMNIVFPSLGLIEKAMVFEDPLSLLFFILSAAAYIAVFLLVARFLYFRGVSGMTDTASKRREIGQKEGLKIIRKRNTKVTYILKEFRLLMRTPVYFLNCVLLAILWPVIFAIPMAGNALTNMNPTMIMDLIKADIPRTSAICILAVFAISAGVSAMNFTAGTAISREGRNFFFMKYIPMSYKDQVSAKTMTGILLGLFSTTFYCLVAMLLLRIPAVIVVLSTVLSFVSVFLFNYLAMVVDLIRPKLNWENEQSAVKQNMNTLVEMVLIVLVGGILAAAGLFGYFKLGISIYVIGISAIVLVLAAALILNRTVIKMAESRLSILE